MTYVHTIHALGDHDWCINTHTHTREYIALGDHAWSMYTYIYTHHTCIRRSWLMHKHTHTHVNTLHWAIMPEAWINTYTTYATHTYNTLHYAIVPEACINTYTHTAYALDDHDWCIDIHKRVNILQCVIMTDAYIHITYTAYALGDHDRCIDTNTH